MESEKPVYVTESHHHVLLAWAELRRRIEEGPRLLTFDYHTDTRPAFIGYASRIESPSRSWSQIADERLATLDFRDEGSVKAAVADLAWDEHIAAAVRAGVLDIAFVAAYADVGSIESNEQIALNAQGLKIVKIETAQGVIEVPRRSHQKPALPPFTYTLPPDRIVILPHARLPGHVAEDEADRAYRDASLDAEFLKQRLDLIDQITKTTGIPSLFDRPFIVDFDLDYFNTKNAMSPADPSVLDHILQRAAIITIAKESSCVKSCQLDGEDLDSDFLEQELLKHIDRATKAAGQKMVVRLTD